MSKNELEIKILKSSRGLLFFADDFSSYASPDNIRQVLSRLEKEGLLVRLAHGIYLKPKTDEVLGVIYPDIEEIARQIAKRDKARIVPTGVQDAASTGLSIPVRYTDFKIRQLKRKMILWILKFSGQLLPVTNCVRLRTITNDCERLRTIVNDYERLSQEKKTILLYLMDHQEISRKKASSLINSKNTKTYEVLTELVNEKFIDKRGQGRGTFYILKRKESKK